MGIARWHDYKKFSVRMGEALGAARLGARWGILWYPPAINVNRTEPGSGQSPRWPDRSCQRIPFLRQLQRSPTYSSFTLIQLAFTAICLILQPSSAAFIGFDNCLSPDMINSNNPHQLQFEPRFVWAAFNSTAASHNVNVTVYGNVTGIATKEPIPPPNDPQWKDVNETKGKIPNYAGQGDQRKFTTFQTQFRVLDYTPYDPPVVRFCNTSTLTPCPVAPVDFTGKA